MSEIPFSMPEINSRFSATASGVFVEEATHAQHVRIRQEFERFAEVLADLIPNNTPALSMFNSLQFAARRAHEAVQEANFQENERQKGILMSIPGAVSLSAAEEAEREAGF